MISNLKRVVKLSFIYKWIRKKVYRNIRKGSGVKIINSLIGEYCQLSDYSYVTNSKIGNYSSIGRYSNVYDAIIGKYCSISWNVTIGAPQHPYTCLSTHAFPYAQLFGFVKKDSKKRRQTKIGNDVWIGTGVVIIDGVNIGDGAVIGANAVVTKDVQPYAISLGIPAKTIKFRFGHKLIDSISRLQWWEWDRSMIQSNLELFKGDITEEKIEQV